MISREEQAKITDLVRETKELIFQEMKNEKVTEKGAADYVTNVDLAVQNFLKEKLERVTPDIPLIAEEKENKNLDPEGIYWILDPIDGTTNLIHDYHLSAVALGLYEKGEIIFGIVYNPYEKNRAKALFPVFYDIFMKCADFRRTGSAELDMCYVACGRQHGYIEVNLKPWDYSAGTIILREAGGTVNTWKGQEPPYLKNANILACAPQFAEILLEETGKYPD